MNEIRLWGMKQNNLKNIQVSIPLGSMTVICGPSGSGKSSLAFETLYAEGQRRYVESLSNYTKQFLNKAPKPDLEGISNIPPALALEQKNSVKNSRSTVATTTEIVDYLRLLYEKIGQAYCPDHHITFEKDNPTSGTNKILKEFSGKRAYILSPVFVDKRLLKGRKLHEILVKEGFLRIYVPKLTLKKPKKQTSSKTKAKLSKSKEQKIYANVEMGEVFELNDPRLKKTAPQQLFYVVVDRLQLSKEDKGRCIDSLSQAYKTSVKYNKDLSSAQAIVLTTEGQQLTLSESLSCSVCNLTFPQITSQLFSFNNPVGACPTCKGFGNTLSVAEEKVIPNTKLSLSEGALQPFEMPSAKKDKRTLMSFCKKAKIRTNVPWENLPAKHKKAIWEGNENFYGVEGLFEYLETKKYKMHVRVFLARYKSPRLCKTCQGTRLVSEAQQVLINHSSISDLCRMTIEDLRSFLLALKLSPSEKATCKDILHSLTSRLGFLCDVGVSYLSLDRPTKTLSGGEYQRINLSNQLGMGLSQILYVLDEPTVGLHPRDNERLIQILKKLNDLGNTMVIVEHDHDVIKNSTYVIEMGPQSGHLGGEILFAGEKSKFFQFENSKTRPFLEANPGRALPRNPRPVNPKTHKYQLKLTGCTGHNLKNINLEIPLNRLVTVTGVSGSGKSSLVSKTLYPALARQLNVEYKTGLEFKGLSGASHIKNILLIDQSPIGKTARSNLMTYMKVYDPIRSLLATTLEAKARGYTPGTFSLNVDGGRCPTCKGLGFEVVDMVFMDDIYILCDACDGKKFRPEILEIEYRKKNVAEIMKLTVAEAMEFFISLPNIRRPLSVLKDVGLEYLTLGQSSSSLSGGERQRLKIAKELHNTSQKTTLYILDEPTTGLHFAEVHLLMKVLHRLVDNGNSVLLVEHNLEVIRDSDYIIDIGPEAGAKGGEIVAHGSPEKIMRSRKSLTGRYLKKYVKDLTPKAKKL